MPLMRRRSLSRKTPTAFQTLVQEQSSDAGMPPNALRMLVVSDVSSICARGTLARMTTMNWGFSTQGFSETRRHECMDIRTLQEQLQQRCARSPARTLKNIVVVPRTESDWPTPIASQATQTARAVQSNDATVIRSSKAEGVEGLRRPRRRNA
ncbi:hypothetical protein R3P38DRAFT_3167841 [Favolaschia claudopus]|uniref:Uncharacterized protein n=1 Tax=Favolaschia claudopus TaxID=2862362 RepID=A0AAW0E4R9_9AGAR